MRIDQTECCTFSLDEAADVGRNDGTAVTDEYTVPFVFNGEIEKVTIAVGDEADEERKASDAVQDEARQSPCGLTWATHLRFAGRCREEEHSERPPRGHSTKVHFRLLLNYAYFQVVGNPEVDRVAELS